MTSKEAFEYQNRKGQEGQRIIISILQAAGWSVQKADQDSWRDITVFTRQGEMLRIEIKNESHNWYTGNIAIETFMGDRPSGLKITTADIWIHLLKDKCTLYKVPDMKVWLSRESTTHKLKYGPFGGKTDNECGGYLVPIKFLVYESWFECIPLERLPFSRIFRRPEPRMQIQEDKCEEKQGNLFDDKDLPSTKLEWL